MHSEVKRLFNLAISTDVIDVFSADSTIERYRTELYALCLDAWNGLIDAGEFERRHTALIEALALAAFIGGLLEAGVSVADLDAALAEQQDYLDGWVANQVSYVAGLARDVIAARDTNMDARQWIVKRLDWWASAMQGLANIATVMRNPDELLTFTGQDGKNICPDCERMRGVTQPASWWVLNDLIPGIPGTPHYQCGGFNCHHYLVNEQGQQRLP